MQIPDTLLAVVYSLIPMLGFGISSGLQKPVARAIGSESLILLRGIFMSAMVLVVLLLNLDQVTFAPYWIGISVGAAIISYFGLLFLNKSLELGEAGVVVPFNSVRVILSSLIGVLFLGDVISTSEFFFIALIFLGIIFGSINFKELKNSNLFDIKSGIPYSLLSALFWGIMFPFFGIYSATLGTILFTWVLETTNILASGVHLFISNDKKLDVTLPNSAKMWIAIAAISTLGVFASFFQNLAYTTGEISVTTAIVSASPAVTVIFGYLFLNERLKPKQYFGVLLILIGIIGVSIF
jgi:drug/metabolite transporter (DMT)-like permease